MKRVHTVRMAACVLLLPLVSPVVGSVPVVSESPNGRLTIELDLRECSAGEALPHYRVQDGGVDIIEWSRLSIDLEGGASLGGTAEVVSVKSRSIHEEYTQFPGKRREVVSHGTETTVTLRESAAPHRRWEVILRAHDDGVAFRYGFPAQEGWSDLVIAGENTHFVIPEGSRTHALPLSGFHSAYEDHYEIGDVSAMDPEWLLGLPLTFQRPDGRWASITEAELTEYAGLYVVPSEGDPAVLTGRLAPLPDNSGLAVRAPLPHVSPWRVIMAGDEPGDLIESDLVLNLSEPNALEDVSWIQPGKTTFPWWNGYYLEDVDFEPGLNTETMLHYIDFCAENGIPYHSLDGVGGQAWYGGPIRPYDGADISTAREGMDLEAILSHAEEKGVEIRLWMHWEAAKANMEKAFPLYREWGIEGVMIDFMNRDDQEMMRFLRDLIILAAENELTVVLHGSSKPTGMERTYPNLLSHESVFNLEYNKFRQDGVPPMHEVVVPYTRMLAGPLDFHQGSFRTVHPDDFEPRGVAPVNMGTPTRNLANYVVYQNHLPMMCDYPSAYRGHPGLPVLVQIPDTWDDTRVVALEPEEYVAIARRDGEDWHLGAMVGPGEYTVALPLGFLGGGRYQAEIWVDDAEDEHGLSRRGQTVTAADAITVDFEFAGASYMKFTPVR